MPVLADLEANVLVTEGDFAALLDSNVSVSDSGPGFQGGSLVISGLAPDDVLGFLSDGFGPGQINFDGNSVFYENQLVGAVTFTADGLSIAFSGPGATATGIEAVIEHITFFNGSDNPQYGRDITFTLTDANGDTASVGEALFPASGDPLNGISFDDTIHGAVGDIDNDGDMDLLVAAYDDGYHLLKNVGTASAPNFVLDDASLSLTGSLGNAAGITLFDIDGDGFLDLMIGRYTSNGSGGFIQTFKGDGAFGFTELTDDDNPFDGITTYAFAAPGLADVDGDGFTDLVVARGGGRFDYFEGTAGGFVKLTGSANPLDAFVSYGGGGSVSFADIDGDGDLDFASGGGESAIGVFLNTSTVGNPSFTATNGPYNGGFGIGAQPIWVDIDNDGDIDQFETSRGNIDLFLLGPASPSILVQVDGVDDPTTTVNDNRTVVANGTITGDLLANDIDPDSDPEIAFATVDGQSIVIGDVNVFQDGTRLTVNYDGSYVLELGAYARNLGAVGSGAANTSLQYTLVYTLMTGEFGGGILTIEGFDDKDILDGTNADDTINAGVGNDYIYGMDGADILSGEDGNDSLFGGDLGDTLSGGAGSDKAYGEAGEDILNGGAGADSLFGGDDNDTLNGDADNDLLDGGAGDDVIRGGLGNDVYMVDSVNDSVAEAADAGYDIIRSTVSISVLVDNVEAVQLQGTADLNADGNSGSNNLQGNAGANILSGQAGVDTINGNDGDDIISGGTANDLLRGGSGADTFIVFQESLAGPVLETDLVYDFSAAEGDIVDLSFIDANSRLDGDQGFRLVSAFSKYDAAHPELTGQMTLTFSGGVTILRIDVNGDARVDYQMKINGDVTGDSGDWLL